MSLLRWASISFLVYDWKAGGGPRCYPRGRGLKTTTQKMELQESSGPSQLGRATEEQVGPSSSGVGDLTGRRATTGHVVWVCVSDAAGRGQCMCKAGAATASAGRREAARHPVSPVLGAPTGHQAPRPPSWVRACCVSSRPSSHPAREEHLRVPEASRAAGITAPGFVTQSHLQLCLVPWCPVLHIFF